MEGRLTLMQTSSAPDLRVRTLPRASSMEEKEEKLLIPNDGGLLETFVGVLAPRQLGPSGEGVPREFLNKTDLKSVVDNSVGTGERSLTTN